MKSLLLMMLLLSTTARADLPPIAANVDIDEHLGAQLPLDLHFTDDKGHPVTLAELFADKKPVVMVLAYLRCESLCDLVLRGLVDSFTQSGMRPGKDFRAVTVSIDPHDRPAQSALRRTALLQTLDQPNADWPFLVGEQNAISTLAAKLGFQYAYDPRSDQYAHPAVAFVLTPDGRISRYLYGVRFRPLDVKLSLAEASRGRVGGIAGRILLTCFRWNPASRRYGFVVTGIMKGGSGLVLVLMLAGLFFLFRAERRRQS